MGAVPRGSTRQPLLLLDLGDRWVQHAGGKAGLDGGQGRWPVGF